MELLKQCQPEGANPTEATEWILYHQDISEIRARLTQLRTGLGTDNTAAGFREPFWNVNTELIQFRFLLYNAQENMFTSLNLNCTFQRDGRMFIKYAMESFAADPYNDGFKTVLDFLFLFMIIEGIIHYRTC